MSHTQSGSCIQRCHDVLSFLRICSEEIRLSRVPIEKARKIQEKRFLHLIHHVYNTVPFYRERWDQYGVHPRDIRSISDIQKLPLISKEELRAGVKAGLFPGYKENRRCIIFNTTGSTGTPLTIGWNREFSIRLSTYFSPVIVSDVSHIPVNKEVFILILGRGDTIPVISHDNPHMIPPDMTYTRGRISFIDALQSPERILSFINEKKPDFIGGYGGTLANLALCARHQNISVHHPRLIGFSGEGLSSRSVRIIEDVFKSPVMTSYVSTETGMIGAEHRYGEGYRVFFWDVVVEIINDSGNPVGPDETGSVVVTTFHNTVTPLIRYSGLDDLARFSPDPDLYGLVIQAVHGRKIQALFRRDMTRIDPYLIDVIMDEIRGVGQYQVIQHSVDEIEIIIVPDSFSSGFDETPDCDTLINRFTSLFGSDVSIQVHQVSSILKKNGAFKTPLIITHVKDEI